MPEEERRFKPIGPEEMKESLEAMGVNTNSLSSEEDFLNAMAGKWIDDVKRDNVPREELLASEIFKLKSLRVFEMKRELAALGISTRGFLEKSDFVKALATARVDGVTAPPQTQASQDSSEISSTSSSDSGDSNAASTMSSPGNDSVKSEATAAAPSGTPVSREERVAAQRAKCQSMKTSEIKKELQALGISTASFLEKSEFVSALAEARADGVTTAAPPQHVEPEVISSSQHQGGSSIPGGNPVPGGGMPQMADFENVFKSMGAGVPGGMPPDVMNIAQQMLNNPTAMQLLMKAQSNPKIVAACTECMSNPASFAKYQDDPEIGELIRELQQHVQ